MAIINSNASHAYMITSILAEDESGELIEPVLSFEDLIFDFNSLGKPEMFFVSNRSNRYRLDLEVDILKITSNRTIGYRVVFASNTDDNTVTEIEFENYFIEDFHEKVHVGEFDFDSLEELVLEPRMDIVTAIDQLGTVESANNGIIEDNEIKAFYDNKMMLNTKDLITSEISSNLSLGLAPTSMDKVFEDIKQTYHIQKTDVAGTNGSSSPVLKTDGGTKNPISLSEIRENKETQSSFETYSSVIAASIAEAESLTQKEIDLGRVIKYTSTTFVSSRYFDISAQSLSPSSNISVKIYPILDLENDEGNSPATFPYEISSNVSQDAGDAKYDFDGSRAELKIVKNLPGQISVEIKKADYYHYYSSVSVVSSNPYTDEAPTVQQKDVNFITNPGTQKIDFYGIPNVEPFVVNVCHHVKEGPNGPNVNGPASITLSGIPVNRPGIEPLSGVVENTLIATANVSKGIEVTVENLPYNAFGIRVFRTEMSNLRSREIVFELNEIADDSYIFVDEKTVNQRVYRYQVELKLKTPPGPAGEKIDYSHQQPSGLYTSSSRIAYFHLSNAESLVKRIVKKPSEYSIAFGSLPFRNNSQDLRLVLNVYESQNAFSNEAVKAMVASYQRIKDLTNDPIFSQEELHKQLVPFVKITRLDLKRGGDPIIIGYGSYLNSVVVYDKTVNFNKEKTKFRYFAELSLVSLGALRNSVLKIQSKNISAKKTFDVSQRKYDVFSANGVVENLEYTNDPDNMIAVLERGLTGETSYVDYEFIPPPQQKFSSPVSRKGKISLEYVPKKWGANIQIDLGASQDISEIMLYKNTTLKRSKLIAVQKVSSKKNLYIIKDKFLSNAAGEKPMSYTLDLVDSKGKVIKSAASVLSEYGDPNSQVNKKRSGNNNFSSGKNTVEKVKKAKVKIARKKVGNPIVKSKKTSIGTGFKNTSAKKSRNIGLK